ncbi:acyltransferase family protein [Sphingorhabdus sp.]|uniref:acyltransferase family protein n=1 Tax=Sphingorhabdus sp. TaxID=1902408 RepID=UPI00391AB819
MMYRREIDGLRAVAVVPVILFHAGITVFSGGYVGVDIFFVISGYLITSILIAELELDKFSLVRFYERRARRILPALFFVMACCVPFAFMWMLPTELKDFAQSLIAVTLFASNVLFWREEGYFTAAAELKPLLHTWSLAVEEQYYLLFPFFLMFFWRFGRKRAFWAVAGLAAASLLLSEWGSQDAPSATFYLAPTRAWELLVGSMCAFWLSGREPRTSNSLSLLGLMLIVFAIFYYDSTTPFPSVYALVPVAGAALIIMFGGGASWAAQLLGKPAFVGIGLISYSAYLWHQPLFAFARIRSITEPPPVLMVALAALSIILAYFSWVLIEKPFRRGALSILPSGRAVLFASGAGASMFVAMGLVGHATKGFESFYTLPRYVVSGEFALPKIDNGYCFYSVEDLMNLEVGQAGLKCLLSKGSGQKILVFGDSLAAHWEPFYRALGIENNLHIRSVTTNWCHPSMSNIFYGPLRSASQKQCELNRRYVASSYQNYDVIVLSGDWSSVDLESVRGAADEIIKNSSAKIIFMPTPKHYNRKSVELYTYGIHNRLHPDARKDRASEMFLLHLADVYKGSPRVRILSQESLFGNYHRSAGGLDAGKHPYSQDGLHISIHGSKMAYQHFRSLEEYDKLLNFITN